MHEGGGYRYTFQRARVASSPEVPKVTWWKIVTFLGYHLHWLTSLETSQHFRKIALRLGIFLAMFRECLCVVARQLAPKCRDFSNVAKLARQCKCPLCTQRIFPFILLCSSLETSASNHFPFFIAYYQTKKVWENVCCFQSPTWHQDVFVKSAGCIVLSDMLHVLLKAWVREIRMEFILLHGDIIYG